jgi:60 kDa SS-A/Ro ribonucleoprotein
MTDSLSRIATRRVATSQREQADPREVKNSAGGYVFQAADGSALDRFLTIGTEGGSFYADESRLTQVAAGRVLAMAREGNPLLIERATAISQAGRAPRNNPALFAIAAAAGLGPDDYRQQALAALPLVARTGSHLLTWAGYAEQFRGWGPAMTKAVGSWYNTKDLDEVVYQVLKYKSREGWAQRDLMRLAHFGRTPQAGGRKLFYDFIMKGTWPRMWFGDEIPELVGAYRTIWQTSDPQLWARIITEYNSGRTTGKLTHEMLPSEALARPEVWEALLFTGLPTGTLIKRLGQMSKIGLVKPFSNASAEVVRRLTDSAGLVRARIHPIELLLASKTYASGHGQRGQDTWNPVGQVIDAMSDGFYLAFGGAEPSGKRFNLAVDVSGSMSHPAGGLGLQCREVAAAMALATAATEPNHVITAFTDGPYPSRWSRVNGMGSDIAPLPISPRQRIDDVLHAMERVRMGGTNCALPMIWAEQEGIAIDAFVIVTDNETWSGDIHPMQALRRYREASGIDAKLIVVAVTPTEFSIADPADLGSLDISGFDSAVPRLISNFAGNRLG